MGAECVVGAGVLSKVTDLEKEYLGLLQRLYGQTANETPPGSLIDLLDYESELLIFMVENGQLLGMAQGTLSRTDPYWNVLIGNVIVRPGYDGRGIGRIMMEVLQECVTDFWGFRVEFLVLTNSPKKGNAGFYRKLGFTPRCDNRWPVVILKKLLDFFGYTADNETVVWVKKLNQ